MHSYLRLFVFLLLLMGTSSCVMESPYSVLPSGFWRAELQLAPKDKVLIESSTEENATFEEVAEGELPFIFELIYEDEQNFYLEIINGNERIPVRNIKLTHDRATNRDSIFINFPVFDSYIRAAFETNIMQGEWIVKNRSNYSIPFVARHGKNYRFTTLRKKPIMDISGNWAASFELESETPYPAIGEFVQEKNRVTGTFLTETGDYRFLEGTIQDNKLYMSCFDGSHAFLFEAKILEDSTMIGSFRSGKHYKTTWKAWRDPNFSLADPDDLTFIKESKETFNFTFENPEGQMVSLEDEQYKGKVKIVQILGTWCPNCWDETRFLIDYLDKHPSDQLAVIGLSFEKHKEKSKAMQAIRTYKEKEKIPYEILYAGSSAKKEAIQSLPMLNEIISYPTLLFIDRKNNVKRIHTGFSGPATSKFEAFSDDFHRFLQTMLKEAS